MIAFVSIHPFAFDCIFSQFIIAFNFFLWMRARLFFFPLFFGSCHLCKNALCCDSHLQCKVHLIVLVWVFLFFVWMFFILATTILNAFDHFWRQFHDNICCSNNGPLCLLWLRVKPNLLLIRFLCAFFSFWLFKLEFFISSINRLTCFGERKKIHQTNNFRDFEPNHRQEISDIFQIRSAFVLKLCATQLEMALNQLM